MVGLIDGVRKLGVDLGLADLIVGTSAGARTGAQLATGALERSAEMYRRAETPSLIAPVGLDVFVTASMRIVASEPDPQEAARRIANLAPLGAGLVPDAERRKFVAAQVPSRAWPARPRFKVTAVDAGSGERAVFDAGSGADLHDALAASGALPGIFPLVAIAGRRYADGGVYSLYNADVAAGCDVVVVLTPTPLNPYLKSKLDAEIAALGQATVGVLVADQDSLKAIGPNPLSADAAVAAVVAGAEQGKREIDRLRALWRGA